MKQAKLNYTTLALFKHQWQRANQSIYAPRCLWMLGFCIFRCYFRPMNYLNSNNISLRANTAFPFRYSVAALGRWLTQILRVGRLTNSTPVKRINALTVHRRAQAPAFQSRANCQTVRRYCASVIISRCRYTCQFCSDQKSMKAYFGKQNIRRYSGALSLPQKAKKHGDSTFE